MSELPQGWKEVRLRDIIKPRKNKIIPSQIPDAPFIGLEHVEAHTGQLLGTARTGDMKSAVNLFEPGDILYSRLRPYLNKVIKADFAGTASAEFIVLPSNQNIDGQFLQYILMHETFVTFASHINQGDRPRVDFEQISSFKFMLPPLEEQRRIVAKLDVLLGRNKVGRQELSAATQLIKRQRQAVLTNIFQELNVNKSSNLAALSTLITSGSRGWAKYYATEGAIFIRVGNTQRDNIALDLTDIQYVQPPIGAEGERTKLRDNDLVISITADIGRVSLIENLSQSAYVNQHVCLIRLENPQLAKFIAWYLVSSLGQEQLLKHNRGMTKAGLGLSDIRNVLIPLPSLDEQREIVRRIEAAFARIDEGEQAIKQAFTLAERLEQATLAKAFRGEL
jgi:type I restriction enzyme S subunit